MRFAIIEPNDPNHLELRMKAVILAGGLGTRISEESHLKPKPMLEIGGMPIMWHIMKIYSEHGINDFIICCGYKSYVIKEFFANYKLHRSDVTIDLQNNIMKTHSCSAEPWTVTLVETGLETGTGGRLRRVKKYIDGDFCMTYGDGVGDIDITDTIRLHKKENRLATVTGVNPTARYGLMSVAGNKVTNFEEKPKETDNRWVNGGFFILKPEALDLVQTDEQMFEKEPLAEIADQGELSIYRHKGFWASMDTLRDRQELERIWASGEAPWRVWDKHPISFEKRTA